MLLYAPRPGALCRSDPLCLWASAIFLRPPCNAACHANCNATRCDACRLRSTRSLGGSRGTCGQAKWPSNGRGFGFRGPRLAKPGSGLHRALHRALVGGGDLRGAKPLRPVVGRPEARQARQGLGLAALGSWQLAKVLLWQSMPSGAERILQCSGLCGRLWEAVFVEFQELCSDHLTSSQAKTRQCCGRGPRPPAPSLAVHIETSAGWDQIARRAGALVKLSC